MPQGLLHGGQDLAVLPGLDVDDPVGIEPDGGERRREQVAPPQAPEHRAAPAGEDAGREQGRGRRMLAVDPALDAFVQRAERQPAPGQMPVDRLDPEGERRPRRPPRTVERHDPPAQIEQDRIVPGRNRAWPWGHAFA